MVELPITSDMVEFVTKVVRLTQADKLEWEITADRDVLLAPLGGAYTAKLEQTTVEEGANTFRVVELTLLKARQELFRVGPGQLKQTNLTKMLGATGRDAWDVMTDVWDRAIVKAHKVADELHEVNRLLAERLAEDDVPF